MKTLFIDLDGTIIETKSGDKFPKDEFDWKFKKGVLGKIHDFITEHSISLFIVITNQAGINEGHYLPTQIRRKIQNIQEEIKEYLSWGHSDVKYAHVIGLHEGHLYRKPSTGALDKLKEYYDINVEKSFMVGDASGLWRKIDINDKSVSPKVKSVIKETIPLQDEVPFMEEINGKIIIRYKLVRGEYKYDLFKNDFSDSDKQFADNCGLTYIDIEDFLK